MAIAHKILVSAYYIMRDSVVYKELGDQYLDSRNEKKAAKHYINKLKQLGYDVEISQKAA